jgi:hypothetical protein
MQKLFTTVFLCFLLMPSFGQAQRKTTFCLSGQYNKTLYDRTIGNNPWGMGLGLQLFFNTSSRFKPTAEFTADAYFENGKVNRINATGAAIADVRSMVNIFGGAAFHPSPFVYLSLVTGTSFVSGRVLPGLKPSFGFFAKNQRWTGKISYINVFDRDKDSQADFGSLSLSVGIRLF